MKKYRLKKEAVPFFNEKHACGVHSFDFWESLNVDEKALEEVKPVYISYGNKTGDSSSSLCGWANGKGSRFEFTIHFPSVKYMEFDKFSKGKVVRKLMDKIQNNINGFYAEFINEENHND